MKHLKTILLTAIFATIAIEASAWCATSHKAILAAVEQQLSKRTQKEILAILGTPLSEVEFSKERKTTTLDADGRSTTHDANDAVVRLENALFALDNFDAYNAESKKKALLTIIYHIIDIHSPANVKIKGLVEGDFEFCRNNGREKTSPRYKTTKITWFNLWGNIFPNRHKAFSTAMYCNEIAVATRGIEKNYIGGTPRKWVEEIGRDMRPILKYCYAGSEIDLHMLLPLEEFHDECMYRAVYRLAYTLNKSLK